ncbi:MAG: hypothetical protein MUF68_05960, partial [Cyclobacteriaceae bacterium]|nr:hypothetical protein [Cyclobacteriaceae bacterium]
MKKLILFLLLLVTTFCAEAQFRRSRERATTGGVDQNLNYANPGEFTIAGIEVSGLQVLDKNSMIALTGLKVGDKIKIPGDAISGAIRKLWNHGLVGDVTINVDRIEGSNVYLMVVLAERPRLTSFKFTGFGSTPSATPPSTSAMSASSAVSATKPVFAFTPQTTAATTTVTASETTSTMSSFVFKPVVTSSSASSSAPNSKPAFSVPVFTFGTSNSKSATPGSSTEPQVTSATTLKPSGFQTSASTPSFSALAASAASQPGNASVLTTTSTKNSFGTPSFVFTGLTSSVSSSMGNLSTSTTKAPFQFSLATPDKKPEQQTAASPASPDGNELYETGADDEPNISFEPVVTLPDNVEIKT